jgi:hypothetical protein
MTNVQYDYEYIFLDNFETGVFSNGPVLDTDMLNLVQDCVNRINHILINNKGLKNLSTFVHYNGVTYKVTVQIPARYS